jgi:hypothetical protein
LVKESTGRNKACRRKSIRKKVEQMCPQDEKLSHRQEESFNVLSELQIFTFAKVGRAGVSSRPHTGAFVLGFRLMLLNEDGVFSAENRTFWKLKKEAEKKMSLFWDDVSPIQI